MPVLVRTTALQSGMRLAGPLRLDDALTMPAGRILASSDIRMLGNQYPFHDVPIALPQLDEAFTFEHDLLERVVGQRCQDAAAGALHLAMAAQQTQLRPRIETVRVAQGIVTQIGRLLRERKVARAVYGSEHQAVGRGFSAYAARAVHLAMVLGNTICARLQAARPARRGLANEPRPAALNTVALGLAALFRDVSLWPIIQELQHVGPLTPAQRERVWSHPRDSADLLPEGVDSVIRNAIRHHHENHSGSGYPNRLAGGEICLFARILRMADAFCAATAPAVHRDAKSPVEVLWEMTFGPYAECYDPAIRKIFQASVSPYPIGSKLRLSCGRYAVVLRHGRCHGLLPEVVIAFDAADRMLPVGEMEGPYQLEHHPHVRIQAFHDEDLSGIYGSEPVYQETSPPLPADFAQLADSAYP
jgi:hypothetical protein